MAFRGASETLRRMDAVTVEVYFDEWYAEGAQTEEIEALLSPVGFQRVAFASPFHPDKGDAFYVHGG